MPRLVSVWIWFWAGSCSFEFIIDVFVGTVRGHVTHRLVDIWQFCGGKCFSSILKFLVESDSLSLKYNSDWSKMFLKQTVWDHLFSSSFTLSRRTAQSELLCSYLLLHYYMSRGDGWNIFDISVCILQLLQASVFKMWFKLVTCVCS